MTKAAEQLVTSGAPGGSSTVARTYALLNSANECIQLYDERGALLQRTAKFFAESTEVSRPVLTTYALQYFCGKSNPEVAVKNFRPAFEYL